MTDWITSTIDALSYFGIGGLMFLENLYPPIPSEAIMPLAGFTAERGEMNFWLVVIAGTIGATLGAVFWYYIGIAVGEENLKKFSDRYGKWLTISREDIDHALSWFARYGKFAVFFGRMVPAIRTIISIPAGLSRMPLFTFLLFTTLGSFLWTFALTYAGVVLENNWEIVGNYVGPISTILVILAVFYYIYRFIKQSRKNTEIKN